MSSNARIALLALCLVLGAIWLAGGLAGRATASSGADDARFAVSAFAGSTQAPGKKSEVCAEELAMLFREGFAIRDVGHSDVEKNYVVFTLTR